MKRFHIIHNDGDEMCTVVLRADLANSCDDAETGPVELHVCVRYSDALEADIEARYSDWLDLALETRRKETTMTIDEVAFIAIEARDRSKSNTHRIDEMQQERSELNHNMSRMATAVEVLATEQRHQTETQRSTDAKIAKIEEKVEGIELAPANDAKAYKREFIKASIAAVVGAILGAILTLIINGGA